MNKPTFVLVVLLLVRSSQGMLGSYYERLEYVSGGVISPHCAPQSCTTNCYQPCKMIQSLTFIGDVSFIVVAPYKYGNGTRNQTVGVGYTDFSTGCAPSKEYSCGTSLHFKGVCPYYRVYNGEPTNLSQASDYCDCLGTLVEMTKEWVFSCSVSVSGGALAPYQLNLGYGQYPLSYPAIFTYKSV
jgi:hypothetical protein